MVVYTDFLVFETSFVAGLSIDAGIMSFDAERIDALFSMR